VGGKTGNASGRNFGEREGGRKSWITDGKESSTVRVTSHTYGSVINHFVLTSRDYVGGLCVEEPTPG